MEYRELQHDQPVPHFDKPNRKTISGVRKIYDQRRDEQVPAHASGLS